MQTLRQGRRAAITPVGYLDAASQSRVLDYLYWTASSRISYRPQEELTPELLRLSLNIQVYTRDAFPLLARGVSENIREDVLRLNGQPMAANDFPGDVTAPRIVKVKQEHKTGRRSTLVVKLHDGNLTESQVDLTSLEFILDCINVDSQARSVTRSSRKLKRGLNAVFQRTKVKYRPAEPLSVGPHQVRVQVSDGAGNRVERTWTFIVAANNHDEDDVEPGDERCDTEPEDD